MDKKPAFESFYNSEGELIVYTGSGNALPPESKPKFGPDVMTDPNSPRSANRLTDCQKAVLYGGTVIELGFAESNWD